jgi:CDP-glucose 4,6-dehydratase
MLGLARDMPSVTGDIRDYGALKAAFDRAKPEIVLHLAAQPIVLAGYRDPRGTYETNVMGTVNLLECVRQYGAVRSAVNVTTDKVYRSHAGARGHREDDVLDGFDPYSNSKSCSELATGCYVNSFFAANGAGSEPPVSTVRSANVIGGGDFAANRIVPDCVRAAMGQRPIVLRNPNATRPYQYALETLSAYLLLAMRQQESPALAGAHNIGPGQEGCVRTEDLVRLFRAAYGAPEYTLEQDANAPRESSALMLDCSKANNVLSWQPKLRLEQAVELTAQWTRAWQDGQNIGATTRGQIEMYLSE